MQEKMSEKNEFATPELGGAKRSVGGGNGGVENSSAPNPEVLEKKKRRKHSREYKLNILKELDKAEKNGSIGGILRREGLYHADISRWRIKRKNGEFDFGYIKNVKQLQNSKAILSDEVNQLKKENKRIKKKLNEAELIIEFQKKISKLLGISLGKKRRGK